MRISDWSSDVCSSDLASYGLDPAPGVTEDLGLMPAMTVQAQLSLVKRLAAGESVSYGHRWTAEHETTLGLVPAGYGEGLPRAASNRGAVWFDGKRDRKSTRLYSSH